MSQGEIDRLLAGAQAAESRGEAASAVRMGYAVLALDPANAQALNMLGLHALYAGDTERAVTLLRRATEADPSAAMLWLNLSSAQRALGNDDGERASLAAAIDLDPYALPALIRKAELHERRGEEARATAAWTTLIAAAPPEDRQPPNLRQIIAHARAYSSDRGARFAAALSEGLKPERDRFDGAELRRFDAAYEHIIGKRQIYTPRCAGLLFPFLPADEYFPEAMFPWLAGLEASTATIRTDLETLLAEGDDDILPYVDQPAGARPNEWTSLNRKRAWGAYFFWRHGERRDDACARFSATAAAIETIPFADIPGRAPTAFFSLLEAGARIPAHTGVTNTRSVVHLPLIVPPGCRFRVGGETREWVEGCAHVFDDTIEHEAWNDGTALRAVLIVDVWNPYLTAIEQSLFRAFYVTADASGLNPEVPGVD